MDKVEILSLDIDQLDFQDRYGQWQQTRGCSLRGREQFNAYIKRLAEFIESADTSLPVADLYNGNEIFRYVCDRCLELNNVDPDWLDGKGALLTSLLFAHDNGVGLLIRLNMLPESSRAKKGNGDGAGVHDITASILAATNSLKEAMDMMDAPDGKAIIKTIEARSKQLRDAQNRSKNRPVGFDEWKEKRQERNREATPKPLNIGALKAKSRQ